MKKLLLAAVAGFALMSASLPAAHAGPKPGIAIGEPYPGYDPYPGHHPYPDYDDGYDDDDDYQISCWEGRHILLRKGFRAVRPIRCSGEIYRYSARKSGRPWSVRLNSYTGRVVMARPLGYY